MTKSEQKWAQAREIIKSSCQMLRLTREVAPVFTRGLGEASADCYVLLRDASKMFCDAVSEHYGEAAGRRWSPALPELFLAHPEKCEETLSLVEQKEFLELSHFQYSVA